ncbi:hypothetical protein Tco_1501533 [Tanacetum coccineum]
MRDDSSLKLVLELEYRSDVFASIERSDGSLTKMSDDSREVSRVRHFSDLDPESPFVMVLTLWSLLLGPGAVPTDTTLSNSIQGVQIRFTVDSHHSRRDVLVIKKHHKGVCFAVFLEGKTYDGTFCTVPWHISGIHTKATVAVSELREGEESEVFWIDEVLDQGEEEKGEDDRDGVLNSKFVRKMVNSGCMVDNVLNRDGTRGA